MTDGYRRGLVSVKLNGAPLKAAALRSLSEVRVEQSLNVPDAFTLRFNDHEGALLSGQESFKLAFESPESSLLGRINRSQRTVRPSTRQ